MQNPFAIASAMHALLQFVLDIDMWAFQTGHKLTLNLILGHAWHREMALLWKSGRVGTLNPPRLRQCVLTYPQHDIIFKHH